MDSHSPLESIFFAALEKRDAAERRAFLDQACAGDDALRRQVERMLTAQDEGFLSDPAIQPSVVARQPLTEGVGSRIGPYRLLQPIGEGGMGVVFLAEQIEPVQRQVAVKIIRPGIMDSRQVIARFEAERQALAMMDHPNIAKVFDAGTTESGQPYFVMEWVQGVPITEYCDTHQLTIPARLTLFLLVCQAVQHAHQKGIIHRDLKPTNVLVADYGDQHLPKVIDFGLAKSTEHKLTERSSFTELGQLIGTIRYMSPEQARLSQLDVDTRSDVYSLGVILYELLTGKMPFDAERFHSAALDEGLRIIREEEPPRPSKRLSGSPSQTLASIAAQRQSDSGKLAKQVRGELDWIVMKCLEKDRDRRYETADALALDVQRHLHHEPVVACPPSTVYKLRKFARRNRAAVFTAALVTAALLTGVTAATWQAVRATRAEAEAVMREGEARAVLAFVEQRVFAAARPEGQEGGLGQDVTLRKALESALPFVAESFADQPLIEARLRMTLGTSFLYLGDLQKAAEQYETTLAIYSERLGPDHLDTLRSMHHLGNAYGELGRETEALKLREETTARFNATLGPDHPYTLSSMNNLGNNYGALGRETEALKLREEVVARRKATQGPDHPDTLIGMNNLANSYRALGRYAEATELHKETLARRKATLGPDHPGTLESMYNLANSYSGLGQYAEALKLHQEALVLQKVKLGLDHPSTLMSMSSLAGDFATLGRYVEALELYQQTLAMQQAKFGPDHTQTLGSLLGVAHCLIALGREAEAMPLVHELEQRASGPDVHPRLREDMENLRQRLQESQTSIPLPVQQETGSKE